MAIATDEAIQLTLEWFFDHKVVAYPGYRMSRRSTDALVDKAIEIVHSLEPDPLFPLHYQIPNIS
jgi:hypothetical protein